MATRDDERPRFRDRATDTSYIVPVIFGVLAVLVVGFNRLHN